MIAALRSAYERKLIIASEFAESIIHLLSHGGGSIELIHELPAEVVDFLRDWAFSEPLRVCTKRQPAAETEAPPPFMQPSAKGSPDFPSARRMLREYFSAGQ